MNDELALKARKGNGPSQMALRARKEDGLKDEIKTTLLCPKSECV